MTAVTGDQKPTSTLKTYIPILEWLPAYDKGWLPPDIIAALTVWALLVPEAMAYATLAGLPPHGIRNFLLQTGKPELSTCRG